MNFQSWSKVLAITLISTLTVTVALAQTNNKIGLKYDVSKEIKIKGSVTEVKEFPGSTQPTLLVVKTTDQTAIVQLAPAEFLKEMDCWIKAGDQVEVVGAKVPEGSGDEIMARQVTFGNNTMVLRDPKGVPVWEAWKPAKAGV